MRTAGIRVSLFNPLSRFELLSDRTVNTRDHRKLLIVDDKVGFTGGVNISDRYLHSSTDPAAEGDLDKGWRDTHLRLRGPAVLQLAQEFERNWDREDPPALSSNSAQTAAPPDGSHTVVITTADGTSSDWSDIRRRYLDAINRAQRDIFITQAYFSPDREFLNSLTRAAGRGVDVRILTQRQTDVSLAVLSARSRYAELLKTGARIFEMTDVVLHAKTATIDGTWSTVGSSNLDHRSFLHNDELNVVVVGEGLAAQLAELFEQDCERAEEIDAERWLQRSLFVRTRERFAQLFDYWL